MKRSLIISLMAIMAGSFMACGGGSDTAPLATSESTWPLIEDDGNGVIFTSYEEAGKVAAQIKFYDNELRTILNDDTFSGSGGISDFQLEYAPARIYLFGVEYGDTTIDQITCDLEKDSNDTLKLAFACYDNAANLDEIVELDVPSDVNVVPCDVNVIADIALGTLDHTAHIGIPWQKLVHMAQVPMKEDRTLYCTGGNKTFYVDIFNDTGIRMDDFTLFFDFVAKTFKGKMVVTEVGQKAGDTGLVLNFDGLQ